MDTLTKLGILADAAKYDAACTSSGVDRPSKADMVGNAHGAGLCHSFTPDGRCVTLLKVLMSGVGATGLEILVLLVGCVVSFVVSLLVIKALMEYVRKHSFASFGYYRIGLGAVVLIYFLIKGLVS